MMKHTKRFSVFICAVLLVLCSSVGVFAEASYKYRDDADIFTDDEDASIANQLESVTDYTNWDIIIYTNTKGVSAGRMDDFCNKFYMNEGFGVGTDNSGVMLTIDMDSREMYIITKGNAIDYFDDERTDLILDDVAYYLSSGDYYEASQAFIDGTCTYYNEGIPVGGSYTYVEEETSFVYVIGYVVIALVIALGVAALAVVFVKLRYKNHGKENIYDLRGNSVTKITDSQDVFLTKHVSVTTVSSSSSGSRGSSGGGSSHGGGGRSF